MTIRQETRNRNFREKLKKELGCTCVNCGCMENIEYHHIVPVLLGGTNNLTNIVPLCGSRHKAAHNGRHISKCRNLKNSGRKPIEFDNKYRNALNLYISGQIGARKCKELLGIKQQIRIQAWKHFKEYVDKYDILEVRNNVDIVGTSSELKYGVNVGYVMYKDGRKEDLIYKDTGANDVEYTKRSKSAS